MATTCQPLRHLARVFADAGKFGGEVITVDDRQVVAHCFKQGNWEAFVIGGEDKQTGVGEHFSCLRYVI